MVSATAPHGVKYEAFSHERTFTQETGVCILCESIISDIFLNLTHLILLL